MANMKRAVKNGIDILPRIPVIPNFNDSTEDARGLSARIREVGLDRAQLLPFHQFGENKYHLLNKTYAYENVPSLHAEELERYRTVFVSEGIDAFF